MSTRSPGCRSPRPIRPPRPSTTWRCSPMLSVLLDGVAAVNQERGPGDVRRVVRGEEQDGGRHLLRATDPSGCRPRRGALEIGGACRVPGPSQDGAGQDGVDTDIGTVLNGKLPGE